MKENYKKLCENRIRILNKHLIEKGIFTKPYQKLVIDVYRPDRKPFIKLSMVISKSGAITNLTGNVFSYSDFYEVIKGFEKGLNFKEWCK